MGFCSRPFYDRPFYSRQNCTHWELSLSLVIVEGIDPAWELFIVDDIVLFVEAKYKLDEKLCRWKLN